jgi:hypothetical protein
MHGRQDGPRSEGLTPPDVVTHVDLPAAGHEKGGGATQVNEPTYAKRKRA